MIGELHKAAVVAESVADAERFYTDVLGLVVTERIPSGTAADDEDYVMLRAGSTTLELMPRKAMGVAPGFHHLSFRVDDVDAAAATLLGQGVTLEKEPFDAAGNLRLAFFRGPDGVLLQLFQRR
jgi:methylmalonyl-CoA/ethylmalonyl-CoA epimerase